MQHGLYFVRGLIANMATIPKPVVPASDWRENDPLLTQQVAERLNTSLDWVWDHSSRKMPLLPVIRFGDGPGRAGMLRYRASKIEEFILEQERSIKLVAVDNVGVVMNPNNCEMLSMTLREVPGGTMSVKWQETERGNCHGGEVSMIRLPGK
jgi:hypothetical protein